jgi:hypothetical protein
MKASDAKALSEKNTIPTELEMQAIYNAIRGRCLMGKRDLYINWPGKAVAIIAILRNKGYKVDMSPTRQPGPDQMRISW